MKTWDMWMSAWKSFAINVPRGEVSLVQKNVASKIKRNSKSKYWFFTVFEYSANKKYFRLYSVEVYSMQSRCVRYHCKIPSVFLRREETVGGPLRDVPSRLLLWDVTSLEVLTLCRTMSRHLATVYWPFQMKRRRTDGEVVVTRWLTDQT